MESNSSKVKVRLGLSLYGGKVFVLLLISSMVLVSLAVAVGFIDATSWRFSGGVGMVAYFLLILSIYFREQKLFWIMLPFSMFHFLAIVSSYYLEGGAYISEQEAYSYPTGGTIRLVGYMYVVFFVAYMVYVSLARLSRFSSDGRKQSGIYEVLLFAVVWLFILVLLAALLVFGSPLLAGIQRFEYWAEHPYPVVHSLLQYGFQFSFLLGVVQIYRPRKKSGVLLAVFTFCVLNGLYGEKFTGIFLVVLYYICGMYIASLVNMKGRFKVGFYQILVFGVIVALLFGLIYFHYSSIHAVQGGVVDSIVSRVFSLQGHTWWGIDSIMISGKEPVGMAPLVGSDGEINGVYYLMEQIAPEGIFKSYLARGITFTMGFPAILIYSVGYGTALFLCGVAGFLIACVAYLLTCVIAQYNLIGIFAGVKSLLVLTHALNMGVVNLLFDGKFIFYFMILIFSFYVSKKGVRFA